VKKITCVALALCLLVVLLGAAAPARLVRLTTINKSGHDAAIELNGLGEMTYYLTLPKGDAKEPSTKVWTVIGAEYDMTVFYFNDGAVAYSYTEPISLTHQTRFSLLEPSKSEPCKDKSGSDLKECLDDQEAFQGTGDFMYKFSPSMWLSKLQP
jgi:hypothetical protein